MVNKTPINVISSNDSKKNLSIWKGFSFALMDSEISEVPMPIVYCPLTIHH